MSNPFVQHGAFSWSELVTPDIEAAKTFYGQLFGWEWESSSVAGIDYSTIKAGGQGIGGILPTPPRQAQGEIPPHWGVYVTVEDVDQTVKVAQDLGATILVPPTDIPTVGRFSVFKDPQGAILSIITYLWTDSDLG